MTANNEVKPIPEGFHTVTPYISVIDVPTLLDFVTKAFNAEVVYQMTRPDGSIGHAEIRIGDSMLMTGQVEDESNQRLSNLYLYVTDVDATYAQALAAGGKSVQPPTTQFYGDRHGCVEDALGNQWWIATHVEDVSPEELERRAAEQ